MGRRTLPVALGERFFRARNALAPLLLALLLVSARHGDFLNRPDLDPWVGVIGVAAVALGLVVRFLVVGRSGIRRSGVHRSLAVATLHEDGPYAHSRNPLYLANGIILFGLTLLFDSRWMLLVALPAAMVAIACLVAAEEVVLAESFGARYARYCARVPRFLPRRPLALLAVDSLDWRRALRKEHGTIFAAVSAAVALVIVEDVAKGAVGARDARLLAAWLVVAFAWALVRRLKRHGALSGLRGADARALPAPSPAAIAGLAVVAAVAAGAAAASWLMPLDLEVYGWLERCRPVDLRTAALVLDYGARAVLAVVIGAVLVVDRRRWSEAGGAAARVVSGAAVGELLKTALERLRPSALPGMLTGNSIPSGHIMNTTLVAVAAWELAAALPAGWRRVARTGALAAVVAQAAARVLHESHWPSDVAPSILLGIAWMLGARSLWRGRRLRVPAVAASTAAYVFFLTVPAARLHVPSVLDRPRTALATVAPGDGATIGATTTLRSRGGVPDSLEAVMRARCEVRDDRCRRVRLTINGWRSPELRLTCGWRWYRLQPGGATLRDGDNRIAIHLPAGCPTDERRDVAVRSLALVTEHPLASRAGEDLAAVRPRA